MTTVPFSGFYATYNGHEAEHLAILHARLRQGRRRAIFLAGDSSLDNKFWVLKRAAAVNGYENVIDPPLQKQDIAYFLNKEAAARGRTDLFALNTAVEATTLSSRACCQLLPQDQFIRDHIMSDDYLVVSVGGNDIALAPMFATIASIVPLVCCTPLSVLRGGSCASPPNVYRICGDWGCACCGLQGCVSGTCGFPPGMGYVVDLFGNRVEEYIRRLTSKRQPKAVVVCMIYFPDQSPDGSWADRALAALGYNREPERLQLVIRKVFELATRRIRIPGTRVIPFALYNILDGSDTRDYTERVEPSEQGGEKMAKALMDVLVGDHMHTVTEAGRISGDGELGASLGARAPGSGRIERY